MILEDSKRLRLTTEQIQAIEEIINSRPYVRNKNGERVKSTRNPIAEVKVEQGQVRVLEISRSLRF